jgi:hypothetical protein
MKPTDTAPPELFERDKSVISKHITNIFCEHELRPEATVARFAPVQTEGQRQVSRVIEMECQASN